MFFKLLFIYHIEIVETVDDFSGPSRSISDTFSSAKLSIVVGNILEADTNQQHAKQRR